MSQTAAQSLPVQSASTRTGAQIFSGCRALAMQAANVWFLAEAHKDDDIGVDPNDLLIFLRPILIEDEKLLPGQRA